MGKAETRGGNFALGTSMAHESTTGLARGASEFWAEFGSETHGWGSGKGTVWGPGGGELASLNGGGR